jgi:hypothetical protein
MAAHPGDSKVAICDLSLGSRPLARAAEVRVAAAAYGCVLEQPARVSALLEEFLAG